MTVAVRAKLVLDVWLHGPGTPAEGRSGVEGLENAVLRRELPKRHATSDFENRMLRGGRETLRVV
jgi:hypothetical protein